MRDAMTTALAWYYATSAKATIGLEIANGVVVATAPYARRWLVGKTIEDAIAALERLGYTVIRGDSS